MISKKRIFRRGSTTYFTSSVFFPKRLRGDVFTLYAFVRTADDLVDCVPQKKEEFFEFKRETILALKSGKSNNVLINDFVILSKKYDFDDSWVLSFLDAMESDLGSVKCSSFEDSEKYMYGSAQVIGLFMALLMNLKKESYEFAMILGKSMQFVNFIRDLKEDSDRGRVYLPLNDAKRFGLDNLDVDFLLKNRRGFSNFLRFELDRFFSLDKSAREGFKFIPYRFLVPIMTAQDMYLWTAKKIYKDPLIVLKKQLKPKKWFIIFSMFKNFLRCIFWKS